jgi:hypothetical protein
MDKGTQQHIYITQAITTFGMIFGAFWMSVAYSYCIGFFCGREHAQAEYRWIERFGNGLRSNMPWDGGFRLVVWDSHSLLGFLAPALVGLLYLGLPYYIPRLKIFW